MKKRNLITRMVIISIFVLISLSNCKQTKKESARQGISKSSIESFDSFYDRFHKDSIFQISRLRFPLGGGPDRGDVNEEWTKENWSMLKTKIYDVDTSQYKVYFKKLKKSFTEKVWIVNSGFKLEYRFELIDNKWFLVSAFELNN